MNLFSRQRVSGLVKSRRGRRFGLAGHNPPALPLDDDIWLRRHRSRLDRLQEIPNLVTLVESFAKVPYWECTPAQLEGALRFSAALHGGEAAKATAWLLSDEVLQMPQWRWRAVTRHRQMASAIARPVVFVLNGWQRLLRAVLRPPPTTKTNAE